MLTLARLLGGLLAGALLAPALAEAQQTLCLRMGMMIQCDTPAPPVQQQRGRTWADEVGEFGDAFNRGQESAARTELLRQQTELLRRQNEQLNNQLMPVDPTHQCLPGYVARLNPAAGDGWGCYR